MVIEQTIDIPVDRRVFFEFLAPRELPAGPAHVELKVTPVREERRGAEPNPEEQALEPDTPITDRLAGIFASAGGITLEQIREERLSKKAGGDTSKPATPHADFLSGILASAGDITMRQIREERLVKRHLS
jgi:hypothetical protein